MTFDYSETFETEEEAKCNCPARFKVLVLSETFVNHLNEVSGRKSTYNADYVCKDCFKPVKFYIQECEYCPEEKCYFYGRPPEPGVKDLMKCLRCKKAGK
jgi:hypothetical protein